MIDQLIKIFFKGLDLVLRDRFKFFECGRAIDGIDTNFMRSNKLDNFFEDFNFLRGVINSLDEQDFEPDLSFGFEAELFNSMDNGGDIDGFLRQINFSKGLRGDGIEGRHNQVSGLDILSDIFLIEEGGIGQDGDFVRVMGFNMLDDSGYFWI